VFRNSIVVQIFKTGKLQLIYRSKAFPWVKFVDIKPHHASN